MTNIIFGVKMFNNNLKNKIMNIVDIIFIFALAFICVVLPVFIKGATIIGSDDGAGSVSNLISWDSKGYFTTLSIILIFFIVILIHSITSYKIDD